MVMAEVSLNIAFQQALTSYKWKSRLHLVHRLMEVNLSQEPDVFHWKLHASGACSVKSLHADMVNEGYIFRWKYIWKLKVSLKINFLFGIYIGEWS